MSAVNLRDIPTSIAALGRRSTSKGTFVLRATCAFAMVYMASRVVSKLFNRFIKIQRSISVFFVCFKVTKGCEVDGLYFFTIREI